MIRAAAILLALLCAGCSPKTADDNKPFDPTVYADRATGCEYLSTRSIYALTPRIDQDGLTHRGCRKTERTSP